MAIRSTDLRTRCAGAQSLPLSCSQADSDRLAVLEWNSSSSSSSNNNTNN